VKPLPVSLDRLGALASLLCLGHCLALPLLAALPFLGHGVHEVLLALVLPLALVAFPLGFRRHGQPGPGLLALLAALGLVGVVALEGHADHGALEVLGFAGSVAMVGAHLWNERLGAACCPPLRRSGELTPLCSRDLTPQE